MTVAKIPYFFGILVLSALPSFASDIIILDAYARSSSPSAKIGAGFLVIENFGTADDRLVAVSSDASMRTEIHTHIVAEGGVMQMREIEGGILIPANSRHILERGGDHIMFMGLVESFKQGDPIPVVLTFENAGEIEINITVDLER